MSIDKKKFSLSMEDKRGDSFLLRINQMLITLTHTCGDTITFKYHKHQGQWKWQDSRCPGSQTLAYITSELARLLYQGDKVQAASFINDLISN